MNVTQILAINYIRFKFQVLSLFSVRKTAEAAFRLFCTPQASVTGNIPPVFKSAEMLDENFNEKKITGYRWNKDKPVKVLILHGFSSTAFKFHRYVLPLVNKGYEVIAFDAPAHGKSEGKTTNAVEYKEMIEMLIQKYGPFRGFIAHSFGGLALSLAMENTPHDAATKMVLIAPATETTTAIDGAFTMLKLKNKKVRAAFDNIILRESGKPTTWYSVNRALQNIQASVFWIHDEEDTITPLTDALITRDRHLSNVRFLITHGLGHRQIYRDEKVKNEVINFL